MTVEGVYDYLMYVGKISVVTVKTRVIFLLWCELMLLCIAPLYIFLIEGTF